MRELAADSSILQLYKELQSEGPVNEEFIAKCAEQFPIGSPVKVGVGYVGIVTGHNRSTGFYHGNRYPVCVKIVAVNDDKFMEAIGCEFPYGLEQLSFITPTVAIDTGL